MAASMRAETSWSGRPAASQWSATSAGSTPGAAAQRLGEAGVHLRGLARHQPSRDGLHEERVGELGVVAGARPEQATPCEQAQRVVHRLRRESRGGTEHVGRHPALSDPQHPRHPPGHVVEVADAPVEEVGEGAGQRDVVRTRGELGRVQRQALAPRVDASGEVVGAVSQEQPQLLGRLGRGERW